MVKKAIGKVLFASLAVFVASCASPSESSSSGTRASSSGAQKETSSSVRQEHVHTYDDEWSYDESNHWHQANCGHDDISGFSEHTLTLSSDETSHWYNCAVCGYETNKEDHVFVDDKEKEDIPATEENEGIHYVICETCGYEDTAALGKLDHSLVYHEANDPTCLEEGNAAYFQCELCSRYFSDEAGEHEITAEDIVSAPLGHNMQCIEGIDPTCTESGNIAYYHCGRCGGDYTDAEGNGELTAADISRPATGHDYEASWQWRHVTGLDADYYIAEAAFACANCSVAAETLDATVVLNESLCKEATCQEAGQKVYDASVEFNGHTYTDRKEIAIDKLDHAVNYLGDCTLCEEHIVDYTINHIYTVDDLNSIATNDASQSYILENDIALTESFTSIGSASSPFTGYFYGNDHKITDFTITSGEVSAAGLFVSNKGIVDSLTIENVTLNLCSSSFKSGTIEFTMGAICAFNYGTIRGCSITGAKDIGGSNRYYTGTGASNVYNFYMGAICGKNYSKITDCFVEGTSTVTCPVRNITTYYKTTLTSYCYYGNVAGYNSGMVETTSVTSSTSASMDCRAEYGSAYASAYLYTYIGGFVGYNSSGSISSCSSVARDVIAETTYTKKTKDTAVITNYNKDGICYPSNSGITVIEAASE